VCRVKAFYKDEDFEIIESYSDHEEELFELTARPFLVKDGKMIPYRSKSKSPE
jgi:hypothetical protein